METTYYILLAVTFYVPLQRPDRSKYIYLNVVVIRWSYKCFVFIVLHCGDKDESELLLMSVVGTEDEEY